ncbi:Protein translocase subunit SECA2, chloroplastic [Apostasia shenzhenica]|uniref:chloroplast protein-transporting ATPase n=1 Tax=Apostasia shenzhenica TaxID=1088818 RepID=A0A2I0AL00_9ASPA|nr:Protein translocase subunit SECA2, chloroplastic [Apostasia shenzhenica]
MANALPVLSQSSLSFSLTYKPSEAASLPSTASSRLPARGNTRISPPTLSRASISFSSPTTSSKPLLDSLKAIVLWPFRFQESIGKVKDIRWSDLWSMNNWVVRDYYRLVSSVNALEPIIRSLSDEQLTAKTAEFRLRLSKGESLADIQAGLHSLYLIPCLQIFFFRTFVLLLLIIHHSEAFAVVREAARRRLGMRHFDVQVIGGAVLHDGCIAEMKTGEGKTLVSTLAAYLNALTGNGVHVVTVNDYLAQRDAEWMGRIHRFLGLSVGLIQELGFDYLRDNLCGNREKLVMQWPKPFHFAIVDEVDSVLIDEGRNPLLISGEASKDVERYPVAAKVAELLVWDTHYTAELKDNSVDLTEEGIALAEMVLETNDLWDESDPWARFLMNALKAKEFYRRDVQYIIRNGKALIINELTGRVEERRRWSEGIHQAVEAKEGLKIQADSVVVAQITYQSLFKLYPKLSGMTGTSKTEEKEFLKMFQMPVIEIPTNLPNIRRDLPIQAFATARGKWEHVREEVEYMFRLGRPVLVGTTSVENSEYLSDLLKERKIPHNVLNARPKYAAREAETIAQAGRKFAITISTNMAGRGTDIILGGNPKAVLKIKIGPSSLALLAKAALMAKYVHKSEGDSWSYQKAKSFISECIELTQSVDIEELEKQKTEEADMYPFGPTIACAYHAVLKDTEVHCSNEGSEVKRLGGLHVIGTSLHESRRIDNQLNSSMSGKCPQPPPVAPIILVVLTLYRGPSISSTRVHLVASLAMMPIVLHLLYCYSELDVATLSRPRDSGLKQIWILQDEMFQKFNFDTEWAVKLISRITDNEDVPIEGHVIVKQLLDLQKNAEKYFFGIRKSLVEFDEVLEHPRNWGLGKLFSDFVQIGGKMLSEPFSEIKEEDVLSSIEQVRGLNCIQVDTFSLPNLPMLPPAFRGIRKKISSLRRWLAICTDDSTKNGRYQLAANLLRKYLGDFLIASYIDILQESGYEDTYIQEIEREVMVKTLDCFWRDHLINMNRLSSAVNIRSFGHRNPLEEYKIDGCRFFISMLSATRRLTVESLLHYWSSVESEESTTLTVS